jgi:inner membrane protein
MLAGVVGVDAVIARGHWSIPTQGLLDEAGHLLTAGLILVALPWSPVSRWVRWALIGSVAIDIDHVPLYTFAPEFSAGGRPPTHSALAAALLVAAGLALPRVRVPLLGLALGVSLHFVRDIATGPGLPLLWPLSGRAILLPYAAYLGLLSAAAIVGIWGLARRHRSMAR